MTALPPSFSSAPQASLASSRQAAALGRAPLGPEMARSALRLGWDALIAGGPRQIEVLRDCLSELQRSVESDSLSRTLKEERPHRGAGSLAGWDDAEVAAAGASLRALGYLLGYTERNLRLLHLDRAAGNAPGYAAPRCTAAHSAPYGGSSPWHRSIPPGR